ncbi:MAG: hypothetical protein RMJ88_14895 [Thermogemmata sp.]|nr:hypothetical protein [Thermogemmata sp.]
MSTILVAEVGCGLIAEEGQVVATQRLSSLHGLHFVQRLRGQLEQV